MTTIPSSLADRYRLQAVLTTRGDAVAIAGRDEILERDVWITLLLDPNEERRAAFRQQAEALARRCVPGAPRVYDGSMRAPQPYVVTQHTPDSDPGALLDVLTDDDAATAELPIIDAPRPSPAQLAPATRSSTGGTRASSIAATAAAHATTDSLRAHTAGLTPRPALVAATAAVLLIAASAVIWVGTEGEAPALADQMPVVQGVDATEADEPALAPEREPEPEPTVPEPEGDPQIEVADPGPEEVDPGSPEDLEAEKPQPAEEPPGHAERPGTRRGQEADNPGQGGGGPPADGPPKRGKKD